MEMVKMTAIEQYKFYNEFISMERERLDEGFATFLLKLPIPMSYEVWWFLHKIKGDLE